MMSSACVAKNIAASDCKTPQIGSFEDGINGTFGLTNSKTKDDVPKGATKANQQIHGQHKLK